MYYANVTIHVLAAMLWLGGMFFLAVVGGPVLRGVESEVVRRELFRRLGERFRTVGWVAIVVLIGTGLMNLRFRGLLDAGVLGSPAFWGSRYGHALAWKLGAVVAMVIASAVHDFVLGPRTGRLPPGSPEALRARRLAGWVARLNAGVGVVLVIAAVRLARGG